MVGRDWSCLFSPFFSRNSQLIILLIHYLSLLNKSPFPCRWCLRHLLYSLDCTLARVNRYRQVYYSMVALASTFRPVLGVLFSYVSVGSVADRWTHCPSSACWWNCLFDGFTVCGSLCLIATSVHLEIAFCRTHFFSLPDTFLPDIYSSCLNDISMWIVLFTSSDFLVFWLDCFVFCGLFCPHLLGGLFCLPAFWPSSGFLAFFRLSSLLAGLFCILRIVLSASSGWIALSTGWIVLSSCISLRSRGSLLMCPSCSN